LDQFVRGVLASAWLPFHSDTAVGIDQEQEQDQQHTLVVVVVHNLLVVEDNIEPASQEHLHQPACRSHVS
jgi:hypothetical protein